MPCNCWGNCIHGTNYGSYTLTATGNATIASNTISIGTGYSDTAYSGNRRSAKWKPPRQVVKVDEKKLIAKPTRSHAKPHQAQSSRAAISVRQFASRVK